MGTTYTHKNLVVWKKSMKLVILLYSLLEKLPVDERFGLRSQMSRAVVSIPSNIAEGSRRRGIKEKQQFFTIAFGSAVELETQIEICEQLNFFTLSETKEIQELLQEILKMLNKLSYC